MFLDSNGKQVFNYFLVKTFNNGNIQVEVDQMCGRCGGSGLYQFNNGSKGVCFNCEGNKTVKAKQTLYTEENYKKLVIVNKKALEVAEKQAKKAEQQQAARKDFEKRCLFINRLIVIGGNNSDFARDLANKLNDNLLANFKTNKLSEKQMQFINKFLKAGCIAKGKDFNKISAFIEINT